MVDAGLNIDRMPGSLFSALASPKTLCAVGNFFDWKVERRERSRCGCPEASSAEHSTKKEPKTTNIKNGVAQLLEFRCKNDSPFFFFLITSTVETCGRGKLTSHFLPNRLCGANSGGRSKENTSKSANCAPAQLTPAWMVVAASGRHSGSFRTLALQRCRFRSFAQWP